MYKVRTQPGQPKYLMKPYLRIKILKMYEKDLDTTLSELQYLELRDV